MAAGVARPPTALRTSVHATQDGAAFIAKAWSTEAVKLVSECANRTCQCDEGYSGAQCEVGMTTPQAPLITSAAPSDQGIGPIPSPSTGLSSSTIIAIVVIILALLAIGIVAFLIVKK
ncbi:hypothetical protein DYB26_013523 [Aphanomyces astaci]|uniref:EGF-like domain-containing protein n=1 Tax=Aphanomyces astaci TaxID=112090 RepID=A0A3R6XXI4_APHAT|nr:hypothetical protein DYB26_013523 [Aphanomyces astaci]